MWPGSFTSTRGPYDDRRAAGKMLGAALRDAGEGVGAIVLGLPRGGVPIAEEVAAVLGVPWDIFLVRKLGLPEQPELAMGAIAAGGRAVLNHELLREARVSEAELARVIAEERTELERRLALYTQGLEPPPVAGRPVVVVDDGLATGLTMRAAVAVLCQSGCVRLVVAVPVGAACACRDLAPEVDALVCPLQPERFLAVGQWYRDFSPTTDEEVRECLARR